MRSLFLSTSTQETDKYEESLACLNLGPTEMIRYDQPDYTAAQLYADVKAWKPDMVVYIGTRWGVQPAIVTLCNITSKIAPMVHLCSDAADPPWFDLLTEYHYAGAFALQVAIDGNRQWPLADSQMTLLTPINPAHFPMRMKPHAERSILCGYAGNGGSGGSFRRELLTEVMLRNLLRVRLRDDAPGSYDEYCAFMSDCRITLDIPYSGTQAAKQIKGRVIEAGLAGSCLLELGGAPISEWFTPGVDYVEYGSAEDAVKIIRELQNDPERTQAIAANLRAKVLAEHSPQKFWGKIMDRIGVQT